jgi:hypothetical protein
VTVAFGTEVIEDKCVVRIVRLFEVAAMESDPDELSLLGLGVLERAHAVASMYKVLDIRGVA